jgi:nucleoside-diphosphate-sugar epimerase
MKIGIIGASSQVGSSLAFYLKHFTKAEPVCFVRSGYSRVFFDISGIECASISLDDRVALTGALKDIDAVVDCTYPSGQLYEIPATIGKNVAAVMSAMPANGIFIYMSTIMAYGMPTGYKYVEHFSIPQTTYAYIKRKAEKVVGTLSAKYNLKGYNFRLGQVHGFLQSVNGSYREKLAVNETIRLDGEPGDAANVIFISSIADAIIKVVNEQARPGMYSLVNMPQWTLAELYSFYMRYYNVEKEIIFSPEVKTGRLDRLKGNVKGLAGKYRPLFESYLLMHNKHLYKKIKGAYRISDVSASMNPTKASAYTDFHLLGKNPGPFLPGIGMSVDAMLNIEKAMEVKYEECLEKACRTNEERSAVNI